MNNDYYMNDGSSGESYRESYHENKPEGGGSREAARDAGNKLPWYRRMGSYERGRMRSCAKSIMNPMFITFIILFIVIAFIIHWYYVRPNWYKKFMKNYYNFKGSNTLI